MVRFFSFVRIWKIIDSAFFLVPLRPELEGTSPLQCCVRKGFQRKVTNQQTRTFFLIDRET